MATESRKSGLRHGNHVHNSLTSVTECVLGLKDQFDDNDLPGLRSLIDDYFDSNVSVDEEHFVQRFLRAFKQSRKDSTYSHLLGDYDDEFRVIVNDFVDGKINAQAAAERYSPFAARKPPKGIVQTPGLVSLAGPDRNLLEEHTNLLKALPTAIPSYINKLIAKIAPSLKDPKEFLYIPSFKNLEFQNHGRTVKHTPAVTCVPKTAQDIAEIVKYAKAKKMGVRVAGFRHSWSPVFGRSHKHKNKNNGDILISTLGLVDATLLPNFTSLPTDLFQPEAKDLNSIVFVDHNYVKGPQLSNGKRYVRVGTSTTNEQLRRWCINAGKVTLPCQIIEVEITMGGSNATICHGAGINNPTLSDLVRAIEYVDANGVLRMIDMSTPAMLRAAAGCFGLIGVVTHLVLEFDRLACALMKPRKIPVVEAIPPPPGFKYTDIPLPLRPKEPLSPERAAEVQRDFEHRAINHFYAEWFWFPYSSDVWVNTWEKTDDLTGAKDYPSNIKTVLQVFGTFMMQLAQNATILLDITDKYPETQTKLLTWLAMKNLDDVGPHGEPIKTWIPDALHFQRGVQNIRVRDLEIEIPLQPRITNSEPQQSTTSVTPEPGTDTNTDADTDPEIHRTSLASSTTWQSSPTALRTTQTIDLSIVQRAWWDAIIACYSDIDSSPQRMPLEMRIMSDSKVTLAPQRGHPLGVCAIEILTLHNVADIWPAHAQKVLDKWTDYRDATGALVPVRPHWAKEWYGYQYRGRPWEEVLRNETAEHGGYRDEIAEWQREVTELATRDGWKIENARRIFGNEALDRLFWTGIDRVSASAAAARLESTNGKAANGGTRRRFTFRSPKSLPQAEQESANTDKHGRQQPLQRLMTRLKKAIN
ncbi:hypothetical protein PV10_03255 [Exophiala mesophila]|uniref:FAD-binding PCMH-type domain-containing protein n=1 Tax=Exophiala mesophila TaxID=212818 RepID=A0A0D1X1J0_EXOME|nr:uncharacterized protein PV10_03255 [Exophiala mesophila]KIV95625.1 hypothetical protein PV10_03255 [Exophiala mesophila]